MKVLDLQCRQAHVFEGWFGSEDDFQDQLQRGLVQCPLCADSHIEKRLSAPRLNLGARPPAAPATSPSQGVEPSGAQSPGSRSPSQAHLPLDASLLPPAMQAAWLDIARKIVASTEDVGGRFAEEARRMHHGEVQERAIRGQATAEEAVELLEEGIAVLPLALPAAAKETLQ
ncbi:MAG: DUF1178 family protein [Gammaproteobacteria bacterium]|jgi:hypothetical protein|nr:DUF1178 family protein [Gammaproteobacteria bacterium]MBU0826463.1 DUF1178 family protein [Gammaproteobacteria bacterium]MBU0890009.1 DUF1178 family protein [Gammaproteobacteria bacterium]MBU1819861.1 DUF1178 family protein [Gammaproteobacteria bacterium]